MPYTTQAHRHPPRPGTRRALVAALACTMPLLAAQLAHAQAAPLVVDPSAANRPALATATNGTPIVNITAPDSAGISHNRFTEYNVNPAGLVLNNSTSAVDTQLAGRIDGNALLGGAPASVILNQVTGVNASVLAGATEVAGHGARVIVANPNGISVDGGSFINANRVSLVAGTTEFDDDGAIRRFRTEDGRISIDGAGLDARNVDQLDLISRTLKVNAALHARRATLVAHRGTADVERPGSRQVASHADGATPDVAIDVSALGSMHASGITMHGSSAGVGVNLAGKVDAVTGGISILSDGRVKVQNGASLTGGGVAIHGNLDNAGVVRAGGGLSLMGNLRNTSTGRIESGGALSSMGNVSNAGTVHADGPMSLMGSLVNERGGRISSYERISRMGGMTNLGELVQFMKRPEAVAPEGDKPVAPTAPVVVAEKPAQPETSTPIAEKPVAPTPPVVVAEKPAEPETSTPIAEKPVAPTPPVVVAEKPAQPETSTPIAEKPVAPTPPVVVAEKPAEPETSTPIAEKPVAPTPPVVVAEKPAEPETSTPITEKPIAPTPPVVVAEKPAEPATSTPIAAKPVAPTPPVVIADKPARPPIWPPVANPLVPPIAISVFPPMMTFPPAVFIPSRPFVAPPFAFRPIPAPAVPTFGMMPTPSMFALPVAFNLAFAPRS
ncbi:filamentous hemagglutinin N-terminal domain-containing protein [Burkholderia pseudomultivorans]|uniref:two-partner secretion domain-containing protein n=1 Tax=Burkholderia pseudomultivorans TaxID=1207504 RepID=UPI000841A0AE|nr:filamentous hemagglutinin N-terminal domain-containing protein [Burkholderia pseudomultivorans]AOI89286.1 filamentous hemagglutinin [Burkholderia pseudomultivorans]